MRCLIKVNITKGGQIIDKYDQSFLEGEMINDVFEYKCHKEASPKRQPDIWLRSQVNLKKQPSAMIVSVHHIVKGLVTQYVARTPLRNLIKK